MEATSRCYEVAMVRENVCEVRCYWTPQIYIKNILIYNNRRRNGLEKTFYIVNAFEEGVASIRKLLIEKGFFPTAESHINSLVEVLKLIWLNDPRNERSCIVIEKKDGARLTGQLRKDKEGDPMRGPLKKKTFIFSRELEVGILDTLHKQKKARRTSSK